MEVVQEENKRKEAEIDLLKRQVRSTAPKPTPPPFPPELERYSQRSERSSEEAPQTIPSPTNPPSPTNLPDVLQYEEVSIETSFSTSSKPSLKPNQPPPLPFLNDIQDPETKHRLKKVQKCVGLKNELNVERNRNLCENPAWTMRLESECGSEFGCWRIASRRKTFIGERVIFSNKCVTLFVWWEDRFVLYCEYHCENVLVVMKDVKWEKRESF